MRTSKPISTISYNTLDFLIDTLQRLKYLRLISYYEFIVHLPDKDDKKEHIHLYIEPNKVLDTEIFSNYFFEVVSDNEKPLKCIHWQNSKYGDWYWYALHDKDYLKAKMLERNCFYTDADIFSSDRDTHLYKVAENPLINYANMSDTALRDYIYKCVSEGYSLNHLLNTCVVPLGKIQSVIHFYNALAPCYSPKKELRQEIPTKAILKKSRVNLMQSNINDILNDSIEPVDSDFVFDNDFDDLY